MSIRFAASAAPLPFAYKIKAATPGGMTAFIWWRRGEATGLRPLACTPPAKNPSRMRSCFWGVVDRTGRSRRQHLHQKEMPPRGGTSFWWRRGESLFCEKATAVTTCHRHVAKSRLSTPLFSMQNKTTPKGGFILVEARGVEPLSESVLTRLSPGAVKFQNSRPAKALNRLCSLVES